MPIHVSCRINNETRWAASVLEKTEIAEIDFDDQQDQKYHISFVFVGKENVENEYVADTAITIDSISINGIDLEPVLSRTAQYKHNTNGQTDFIQSEYTDFVGFDGSINFEFGTPIFKWLYQNYPW